MVMKQREELNKCYEWWGNLTEEKKFIIMMDWYPEEIEKDTDIDKMFGNMANEYQLEICRGENK